MKGLGSAAYRVPVKFRMAAAENLVPIRLDIEMEGQRYKDAFTWNPSDPDSEVVVFAKRTAKELKLPPAFVMQIASSIQAQLAEFRSYEGQDMFTGDKIVPIKLDLRVNHTLIKDQFLWDMNNLDGDPEEFAIAFCKDIGIEDPEVPPAIAFAIREQLYEVAIQCVAATRESRMHKKGRRGYEHVLASKAGKGRNGKYMNPSLIICQTRKWLLSKQGKKGMLDELMRQLGARIQHEMESMKLTWEYVARNWRLLFL